MPKDRYAYVAVFSYDDDGICINFPDLPGCCPCADPGDMKGALKNAKEALGLHIWGMEQDSESLPAPTPITSFHLNPNQIPVLIDVFMPAIREHVNSRYSHEFTYPAIFTPFDDSSGFTVEFPDLPGCVTEGRSLSEALEMASDAASGWILDEIEDGHTYPSPSSIDSLSVPAGSFVRLILLDINAFSKS